MDTSVDVLIAGAGPVGLSLAIELGLRGVTCQVVEQNDRVGYSPRAKMTNVRTREHLRRWGIADELRRVAPIRSDYPANVVFATRMNGHLLARFENAFSCGVDRNDLYAEGAQWVPQYTLEEVLRARAVALPGIRVTFDTALESLDQTEDGVMSTVVHASGRTKIRSRYAVGADGARSLVRKLIGVRMTGDDAALANLSVVLRSPELASLHSHGPAVMYWMVNDEVPALLGPMSDDGLWYFMATKIEGETPSDIAGLIRRSTGLDFDMEILRTDPWVARRLIADGYRRGNVFLAGDACHLHPPFGGFGMNMGVGDAVDLGWKIAATLQGWGGVSLLDSYEAERRPVHEWAMNEAVANYAIAGNQLARPGLESEGFLGDATRREVGETILTQKIREMRTLGVVKGYRYEGSPIIVPDGSAAPVQQSIAYEPSAHPGCVAPHLWQAGGASLYDTFGQGFTLLVTEDGHTQTIETFSSAAKRAGLPLTVVEPRDTRLRARYGAPLALIRPDQHVAWRGHVPPADLIDIARGTR